jgi:hypothetical protein
VRLPPAVLRAAAALAAGPAAGAWAMARGRSSWAAFLPRLAGAAVLLFGLSLPWMPAQRQTVLTVWGLLTLGAACALALAPPPVAASPPSGPSRAPAPQVAAAHLGWRSWLQLALLLALFVPCLEALAMLLAWQLSGGVLAWLDPDALAVRAALRRVLLDAIWAVPLATVFAGLSCSRGRSSPADLPRALAAWTVFFAAQELLLQGAVATVRIEMVEALGGHTPIPLAAWAFRGAVILAAVPLTWYLAWGPGRPATRVARGLAAALAVCVHVAVLTGLAPQVDLAAGQILERAGAFPGALACFERSLRQSDDPPLHAFAVARIGILRYRMGDVGSAGAAFRRLQAAGDPAKRFRELGDAFLSAMASPGPGVRRDLPTPLLRPELRDDYCAPNTLARVMLQEGRAVGVAELAERATTVGDGTSIWHLGTAAEESGFEHIFVVFATLDDVTWLIDRGIPPILYTPGHALAVWGYDEPRGLITVFDTAAEPLWSYWTPGGLEAQWGERYFRMSILLSRDAASATAAAVRARFRGSRSRAAIQWQLALDQGPAAARLRQAILSDPSFFPAAFDLLALKTEPRQKTELQAWIDDHVDAPALVAKARSFLVRDGAPRRKVAEGLGRWYLAHGQWQAFYDLSLELDRDHERWPVPGVGAGAKPKQAPLHEFLSDALATRQGISVDMLDLLQQTDLGSLTAADRDETRAQFERWVEPLQDDRLERALRVAEAMAPYYPHHFLERCYLRYLSRRPDAVDVLLRLARFAVDLGAGGGPPGPQERAHLLEVARRAATAALAQADDPASRRKAQIILDRAGRPATGR